MTGKISNAGLLIAIAFLIPVIIELRTLLAFFGINLSTAGTIIIGAIAITAVVLWLNYPQQSVPDSE